MGFIADEDYPRRGVPSPNRGRCVETRLPPAHDDIVRFCAVMGHHDDTPRISGIPFKVGLPALSLHPLRLSANLLRDVGPPEVDPSDNKRDDCVDSYQLDGEQNRGLYRVNPAEL